MLYFYVQSGLHEFKQLVIIPNSIEKYPAIGHKSEDIFLG